MPSKDREKNKEYARLYREKNKEKINEYKKTHKGLQSARIGQWKYSGLKESRERMIQIYERWLNTTECDCCKEPIREGKGSKVLDHCHKTGLFRNVLCVSCNNIRG